MKIAYITAGAAGMYCGSCMHDNTLAAELIRQGHDVSLIPTYTPIRTDERDVSQKRIFLGGINVYLQQKLALFRHTPWLLDRIFDAPKLLRWISRFAMQTQASQLGDLSVSMLQGEHGKQKKEITKLVRWLASEHRPEVIVLTTALLAGIVPQLQREVPAPILCTLQGDDIFLDALPEESRRECLSLIRRHCRQINGFIATCGYYADYLSQLYDIPRDQIHVVYPGLNLEGHGREPADRNGQPITVGYFARICPEKGLHVLVDAFIHLHNKLGLQGCRLHVSGWLGESNREYLDSLRRKLHEQGLSQAWHFEDAPDLSQKVKFIRGLDILSVPTVYREPKGLYILEAMANGVPVVQPRHGSFPELIEHTGGGVLVEPDDPEQLAQTLCDLALDPGRRTELGRRGQAAVHSRFTSERMARDTLAVLREYL